MLFIRTKQLHNYEKNTKSHPQILAHLPNCTEPKKNHTFFNSGVELRDLVLDIFDATLKQLCSSEHLLRLLTQLKKHVLSHLTEAAELPNDVGQGVVGHTLQLIVQALGKII